MKPQRHCIECGDPFSPSAQMPRAEFCSVGCRKAFHNRRAVRGAELYDLIMALRCDRKNATLANVWKVLCRLVAAFRDEDIRERKGRKSWRDPSWALRDKPWLRADVLSNNIAGVKRR